MTTLTRQIRAARAALGKPDLRTKRACTEDDIWLALRKARDAKKRVRVYSPMGFVPNSYRWRCDIQYIEVTKDDAGLNLCTGWGCANRPRGAQSRVIVDNRAA